MTTIRQATFTNRTSRRFGVPTILRSIGSAVRGGFHVLITALMLGAAVADVEAQSPPSDVTAVFDWFEYTGEDPVYKAIQPGPDEFLNPILAGFHPDPSMVRAGDDYYIVNSSFAYYPGIPIFHSTDLVNWTKIGHAIHRPEQFDFEGLGVSRGVFAPTIRYNDGTFYVICTFVDAGGNFIVTAEDPAGPWSDPVWLPFDGIDPSMFFDDDGRVYITNNGLPDYEQLYSGHRALWIQEYDPEARTMVGERTMIVDGGVDLSTEPIWIEAPHIFKIDGLYYLIAAEGGTAEQHSEVVFRSDSPTGPYEPFERNPILTQRHLDPDRPRPITTAGHADFVQLPNGDWWSVFLGTRPYLENHYNIGRETFLMPVRWEDGQPIITSGDELVPYVLERPSLPPASEPPIPTSGNFTVRDEFEAGTLGPSWNWLREPVPADYDLSARPDALTLHAGETPFHADGPTTMILRRQQHSWMSVSTSVQFDPRNPGDSAGLLAFQNEDYWYYLGVENVDGTTSVTVRTESGPDTQRVLAERSIENPSGQPIRLKINARGAEMDFHFALGPDDWAELLTGADATILSTKSAGGFVGTMLGLTVSTGSGPEEGSRGDSGAPELGPLFRDGAVLQAGGPIPVFGTAPPGEPVTVRLAGQSVETDADPDGHWSAHLPATPPGGPFELRAETASGGSAIARDVLIGDVYLCSGQSNMALPVSRSLNAPSEIATSSDPEIRMITIPNESAAVPLDAFRQTPPWEKASPETVADWSAVCFYFARELRKSRDVPVGLIHSSWGGSDIRAWMDAEALAAVGGYEADLSMLETYVTNERSAQLELGERWEAWYLDATDTEAASAPWTADAGRTWAEAPSGLGDWKSWGDPGLEDHLGMVWHRATVDLLPGQASAPATLSLGSADEIDQTWINGRIVGNTFGWGTPRTYEIPADLLVPGENTVVVNVMNSWGAGGLTGPAESRYLETSNGERIPIADWRYRKEPTSTGTPPRAPWEAVGGRTTIYNAMVAPIGPYGIRGVLWYQGESNTGTGRNYADLLEALVSQYRRQFGEATPVLVVQLAGFGHVPRDPVESGWAEVREAQRLVAEADDRVALAVAVDVGDRYDIHPPNKQEVARRLARTARRVIYGEDIPPSGPAPVAARRDGEDIVVEFSDVTGALEALGHARPIGFELCGAQPGSCQWADARIDGDAVRLNTPVDTRSARVRYCWGDHPVCTLVDATGLPAGPFELDIRMER